MSRYIIPAIVLLSFSHACIAQKIELAGGQMHTVPLVGSSLPSVVTITGVIPANSTPLSLQAFLDTFVYWSSSASGKNLYSSYEPELHHGKVRVTVEVGKSAIEAGFTCVKDLLTDLPFEFNCSGRWERFIAVNITVPHSIVLRPLSYRPNYYLDGPLHAENIDLVRLDFKYDLVGAWQEYNSNKYRRVTSSITPFELGRGAYGVAANKTALRCRDAAPGNMALCDTLTMTYSTRSNVSLGARIVSMPPGCEVRAAGVILDRNTKSILTAPDIHLVQKFSQDVRMEVKCAVPGKYTIPVLFERKIQ